MPNVRQGKTYARIVVTLIASFRLVNSSMSKAKENLCAKTMCFGTLKDFINLSDPDSFDEFCKHLVTIQSHGHRIVKENNVYLFEDELYNYFATNPVCMLD